jgi:hypothetical protein
VHFGNRRGSGGSARIDIASLEMQSGLPPRKRGGQNNAE